MNTQRSSRVKLVAVIAVFAVPVVLAYVLNALGWRPAAMRNYGELVQPPVEVSAAKPLDAKTGEAIEWGNAAGHFRLVMPAPAGCGERCTTLVDTLNGLWRGLGSDATRLEVFVAGDVDEATRAAIERFEVARHVSLPAAAVDAMPAAIADVANTHDAATGAQVRGAVALYVVDPRGFVILRYAPGYDIAGVRRDLTRLIR